MSTDDRPAEERYAGILAMLDEALNEELSPEEEAEERRQAEELDRILNEEPLSFREPEDLWTPAEIEALEQDAAEEVAQQAGSDRGEAPRWFVEVTATSLAVPDLPLPTAEDIAQAQHMLAGLEHNLMGGPAQSWSTPPVESVPVAPGPMILETDEQRRQRLVVAALSGMVLR